MQREGRLSLKQSFAKKLSRITIYSKENRLKGRNLFRAAVRLVLEYMNWFVEDLEMDEIVEDFTIRGLMIQPKKVDKKPLKLQDRSILLSHPNIRTKSEEEHIYELLKKLRAFRKHPEYVKKSLASVCRYQYFSPNRVIVRQGHEAENLYFIIHGEVSLSRTEIDSYTGETREIDMGIMGAEDMFGEIALLHKIPRTATVVNKTTVDLLLIPKRDFDSILRDGLTEAWNILQDALVHFNYFKAWDENTIRECCILSRIKKYKTNEVILGDGKGMINHVHFVLNGKSQLIEHLIVKKKTIGRGTTSYSLFDREKENLISKRQSMGIDSQSSKRNIENPDNNMVKEFEEQASKNLVADVEMERDSIITTSFFNVINEWHEITDVAELLMKQASEDQFYPRDVQTIFIQICIFSRGACFGLGEQMLNRRIVAKTEVECLLIPRYWLFKHNRANIWERVKLFMDSQYPTRKQLFKEFIKNRKWMQYKKQLFNDIFKNGRRRPRNYTTIHDVPYSMRITDEIATEI